MEKLEFSLETRPDHCLFTLRGALTLEGLFAVQNALRAENARLTIVDMSAVSYVDSAGIGALVNAHVSRENRGARLVLVGVSRRVMDVLEITRVASVLHFAATVEAAAVAD